MHKLPEAVFTWTERGDGLTEVIQGRAPIRGILYEIARQAHRASAMEDPLPGQSQDPPSDEFLAPYFAHLHFPENRRSIVRTGRYGSETLFEMDYVDGLPVKTSVVARDGKILFCSTLYDINHSVDHGHVLRTANIALEVRLRL